MNKLEKLYLSALKTAAKARRASSGGRRLDVIDRMLVKSDARKAARKAYNADRKARSQKPPWYFNASSRFGASMGRKQLLSGYDFSGPVSLQRVPIDSQGYDPGGAYWGGGRGTQPLYAAFDENGDAYYVRAASRQAAKAAVLARHPKTAFKR